MYIASWGVIILMTLIYVLLVGGESPWLRGSVLGLSHPGFEFRILCLEVSVFTLISPFSVGSPSPIELVCVEKCPKARFISFKVGLCRLPLAWLALSTKSYYSLWTNNTDFIGFHPWDTGASVSLRMFTKRRTPITNNQTGSAITSRFWKGDSKRQKVFVVHKAVMVSTIHVFIIPIYGRH